MAGAPGAFSRQRRYRLVKRVIDVTVASTLLVVAAPVMVVTAAAIAVGMGRPVLFRQERPGLGAQPFTILKFRTMRDGPGTDAERMTRVGRLVRSSSLDELPQLVNVLRGEMSLVGPRPLLPHYLPLYSARQARRHDVLPGITGLAQINGRNELPWAERLELDVQYVERCSLRLDLDIIRSTVRKTAAREGISAPGSVAGYAFTGTDTAARPMGGRGAA